MVANNNNPSSKWRYLFNQRHPKPRVLEDNSNNMSLSPVPNRRLLTRYLKVNRYPFGLQDSFLTGEEEAEEVEAEANSKTNKEEATNAGDLPGVVPLEDGVLEGHIPQ